MATSASEDLLAIMRMLDAAGIAGGTPLEQVQSLIDDLGRLEAMVRTEQQQTSREKLLDKLDEDRIDTLRLLADACLDESRDEESRAWLWLASHRKWPLQERLGWQWVIEMRAGRTEASEISHHLPGDPFARLIIRKTPQEEIISFSRRFKTVRLALEAAVAVLSGTPLEEAAESVDYKDLARELFATIDADYGYGIRNGGWSLLAPLWHQARAALDIKD